jgi:predicted RNA methylase
MDVLDGSLQGTCKSYRSRKCTERGLGMNIDSTVLDVLSNATMEGNSLKLTGQLDRALYVSTNKVLEAAGGKWNRKAQAHLFESDAAEIMDTIILTGKVTNKKQELGYFPTPAPIVERMLKAAHLQPGMLVLEPSAGTGNIVRALINAGAHVIAVELDPNNCLVLERDREISGGLDVKQGDFLSYNWPDKFERIVMNPPFARQADIRHVMHALRFLAPGGRLVSIMSSSVTFRTNSLTENFREALRAHRGTIEALPEDSFKESGTGINTVMVTMEAL